MIRDYLVFWSDDACETRPLIVRVEHPPHEVPKGSILLELLCDSIPDDVSVFEGAVQLPDAHASIGTSLDLALATGQVASVECCSAGWRVHA